MGPRQWRPILKKLKANGIEKINFAGGEPTLHKQFLKLCSLAKELGFVVSVVSNGSKIDEEMIEKMKGIVDWIGLSVDSPSNDVEKELERQCDGVDHIANVVKVSEMTHKAGMKVKLNITVVRQSWNSDFTELIRKVAPERLKAFKVMKVEGQNEDTFDECSITQEQWDFFRSTHEDIVLDNEEKMVFEGEGVMVDSYLMLDPIARIMINTGNEQNFRDFDELPAYLKMIEDKYEARGALHNWGGKKDE